MSNRNGKVNTELVRSLRYSHSMCMFVPLRLGVWAYALVNTVVCFVMLVRMFNCDTAECRAAFPFGGYHHQSRTIIGFVDFFGIFMGLAGIVGCWREEAEKTWIFLVYQVLRILAWLTLVLIDSHALNSCEKWIKDIMLMVEVEPWNPIVYQIALDHKCQEARAGLFLGSVFLLFVFFYWAIATYRLLDDLKDDPAWLLDGVQARQEMDEASAACPISRPDLSSHGQGRFMPDATGHTVGHAAFSNWLSVEGVGNDPAHYGTAQGPYKTNYMSGHLV